MTRSIAAVVLLVSLAAPLRAQHAVCFRGRPLPQCRAFWLTEFGLSLPDGPFVWELGGMRNVGTHSAVGGTLYLRVDGGTAYGVKPRFRRWLSPVVALDVSPGIIILAGARSSVGFAGHVGVSLADLLALSIQAETVPPDFTGGKRIKWSGGARLGAAPGAITGIAGLALLAAYALACGGGACFD
jgi:hypothetical protein